MRWIKYVPKFIRTVVYDAIAAEVNTITLPVAVPEFGTIKTTLLAKVHAILFL